LNLNEVAGQKTKPNAMTGPNIFILLIFQTKPARR